jgi:hypothetical protein
MLQLDNPDNIQDPVFGLLGNEVALLSTKSYQLMTFSFPFPVTDHRLLS